MGVQPLIEGGSGDGGGHSLARPNRPLAFPQACAFAALRKRSLLSCTASLESDNLVAMGATRHHQYRTVNHWTGNLGKGTSTYTAYSRNFELSGEGKAAPILGSSDPAFRGDAARYNPEDLLVGALSSCHMLWVLHLCADAGITITEYLDEAQGEVIENPDGSGEFTRVVLRPRMRITDPSRIGEATELHHRAHQVCALARSMNFAVENEPQVTA